MKKLGKVLLIVCIAAAILIFLYRKKKFNGEIFFAYMGWYGLGRAYIETLRADSLYIVGNIKFSVVVGIVCVIAAIIGEITLYRRYKEEQLEMSDYKSAFEAVKVALSKEEDALKQGEIEEINEEVEEINEGSELEELEDDDAETLAEQDLLDGDINEIEPDTEE